mmetsp:Transcript_11559/g.16067  ORF Transcript_11559/g.16067 Transcript_11559/m.16067 type:complete len:167 (-) Transcript_11559:66-566(-)
MVRTSLVLFLLITLGLSCKIELRSSRHHETINVPVGKNPSVYDLKPIKDLLLSSKNTIEVRTLMEFFEGSRTVTFPSKIILKNLDYHLEALREDPLPAIKRLIVTDGTTNGLMLKVEHQGTFHRYGADSVCLERVMDMITCIRQALPAHIKTSCRELYDDPNNQSL